MTATIEVGGRPETSQSAPPVFGSPSIDRSRAPTGSSTTPEYAAAVRAIAGVTADLAYEAYESLYRIIDARDPVPADFEASMPPRLGHEVVAINRAQIDELAKLEPPRALAADHDRYLSGLRELGRLQERFAGEVERAQFSRVYDFMNTINTFVHQLRTELSPRFRELVPRYPLSCCSRPSPPGSR